MILPFVADHLSPETTEALDASNREWDAWELTEDDDYWALLAYEWTRGGDLVICEHDVIPAPGQIAELLNCTNDWCGYTTPYVNGDNFGMGLVKFGGYLRFSFPNAITDIGRYSDETHEPKHWCRLDLWLQRTVLWPNVGQPCIHGSTGHTNREPKHGCHLLTADAFHA